MSRFRLSRRTCLEAAGVSLALPFLDMMQPSSARAQAAAVRQRFLCVYSPNGFRMNTVIPGCGDGPLGQNNNTDSWIPAEVGPNYTLSPLLQELAEHQSAFTVITGLGNYPASIATEGGGSHTRGCAALLTGAPVPDNGNGEIRVGISMDQKIANVIGTTTKIPSLQVGTRETGNGTCEDQYSCAFVSNISWASPTTPLHKQVDPRDIFDRLFGDGVDPIPGVVDNRYLYQVSILDAVGDRTDSLLLKVGQSDRVKLEEYLTAVRSVEQRISLLAAGGGMPMQCVLPDPPAAGPPEDFQAHLDIISDLVALAFQCDVTRVGTYMFETSFSDARNFSFLGVNSGHHSITHDPNGGDQQELIDRFYLARFNYLIGKLKGMTEGDSNVLNNSIVYLTSEFGDPFRHDFRNAPMLIAGSGGGKFKVGHHIKYELGADCGTGADGKGTLQDVQLSALHLTTLQAFGLPDTEFGDDGQGNPIATSTLSEILA